MKARNVTMEGNLEEAKYSSTLLSVGSIGRAGYRSSVILPVFRFLPVLIY
jgi:hypothetical protein